MDELLEIFSIFMEMNYVDAFETLIEELFYFSQDVFEDVFEDIFLIIGT